MKLSVRRDALRLKRPLQSAHGEVTERVILGVSIVHADGEVGHGEAAPLEQYDGVSLELVEHALESYGPVLAGADAMNGARIIDECRRVADVPAALAAIDLALWDRAGKRIGKPVAALITDRPAADVTVNATLSAVDRAGAAEQAAMAVKEGFMCLKLKVGVGDDAGRVAAVRAAAGPEVALRLDANGAWGVEQAVRAIDALSTAGLELVEEPTHGLNAVRAVRERVAVRVSIDETAAEDLPLRWHLRAARRRHTGARVRRGGLSGLHARRPAGSGRGGARRRRARLTWPARAVRAGHARNVRGARGPAAGTRWQDRAAHGSRTRGRPAQLICCATHAGLSNGRL